MPDITFVKSVKTQTTKLWWTCIVGCITNFIRLIITRRKSPSIKSIQKSKNHQRRIFLHNYYRQRCLV
jgi:hypothetical protein